MFARNEVRRPAVAGDFYPSGAQELKRAVEALLSQAKKRELSGLCGVVAPHAGYPYSGPLAGEAFSLLARSSDALNRILLIGPPHYVPVRGIVAPSSSAFATPLGDVGVDVGAVEFSARCRARHYRRYPAYGRACARGRTAISSERA